MTKTRGSPPSGLPRTAREPPATCPRSQMGCPVDNKFFHVETCDAAVSGGYRPPDGVVLCKNHLAFEKDIASTMQVGSLPLTAKACLPPSTAVHRRACASPQHELIHAFDACRAKNLDWDCCEDHACSEVRAAALSGDCDWDMEFRRGNVSFIGQWKVRAGTIPWRGRELASSGSAM